MDLLRTYNAAVELVDHNITSGRGDKPAFIDPHRTLTYGALHDDCVRMGGLLEAYGLSSESRVAMLVLDTVDFPVIFLGSIRAGVIPVALNTLLTSREYEYILADCRAQALFVSAPLLETVEPILDGLSNLRHIFVVGASTGHHRDFAAELAAHGTERVPAATHPDETAFWLYSSGSTGTPKGAMHVHTSAMRTAELYGQGVVGYREEDVVFSAAKLFFAYGLGNALSFPLSVGATSILWPERPTPRAVFDQLRSHQVTIFGGVPTLYASMLADPECTSDNGSARLRRCISAGEALPPELGRAWKSRFGVDILDGVGSTEMLHIFVSNYPDEVCYGRSGKAVSGYDLRVVDEDGNEVAHGEIGELLVRGPTAASGYWNQRTKSRATFAGEWTRTGDKFKRDADGYYEYCGRTDDMFKVSGIWVSPFEVESALVSHDSVLEAAVVAAADEDGLIKPKAFVVLKKPPAPADLFDVLKAHVKAEVGPWKYPRWIEFVDQLPKTSTGKTQRFKLREI